MGVRVGHHFEPGGALIAAEIVLFVALGSIDFRALALSGVPVLCAREGALVPCDYEQVRPLFLPLLQHRTPPQPPGSAHTLRCPSQPRRRPSQPARSRPRRRQPRTLRTPCPLPAPLTRSRLDQPTEWPYHGGGSVRVGSKIRRLKIVDRFR
jgi:hypothetical protein